MATNVKTAIIAASGTVSSSVFVGKDIIMALEIPTIDVAVLYLQVSMKEAGTYRRLLKADGSADWNVASGTGNRMIFIDEAAPFNFIKVEASATQTAEKIFNFFYKGDSAPYYVSD